MIISAMLAYEVKYLTIVFPCTEQKPSEQLRELDAAADIHDMWVHSFVKPMEFYRLEQQSHNLDELNYFAKRMDSLSDRKLRQFYAAMEQEKFYNIPVLIKQIAVHTDLSDEGQSIYWPEIYPTAGNMSLESRARLRWSMWCNTPFPSPVRNILSPARSWIKPQAKHSAEMDM